MVHKRTSGRGVASSLPKSDHATTTALDLRVCYSGRPSPPVGRRESLRSEFVQSQDD